MQKYDRYIIYFEIFLGIDPKGDLSFLDIIFDTIFEIPDSFVQIKRTATNILDELGNKLSIK